ncbi:hypothetical protein [Granulicella sibirica]|uniref:Uncharacterized protein n=1 Tax=Granulicella sibirica TaxID=2479048 RepID=A0A4V1L5I8_9BACT|nr:hypothetical protein [Granulicella sibirica]RXH55914.1 hypothetical protein GRAN_2771 [Granulicella sibirica]
MIGSSNTPSSHLARYATTLVLLAGSSLSAHAADTHSEPSEPIHSVKALIGVPGIAPGTEGTLSFDPRNLRFTSDQRTTEIARNRIIEISSGDERVETGGKAGRVARVVIPYGGGLALGAMTHKKVGLLTVEFTDVSGDYHGAVFVLSTRDMDAALDQFETQPPTHDTPIAASSAACPASNIQPNSVRVEVIGADLQSAFPAEDRVLLYEHLVQQLQSEKTIFSVYRAGDSTRQGRCAEFTIAVQATAFTKGDQAVRASVGPLGHFVGTTRLKYHLTVSTQDGTPIVSEDMKKSEGSDTDSLNVTRAIGKSVVKSLKKSRTQLRKTQVA